MSADICTWEDCHEPALMTRIADDGEQWANLCEQHAKELEHAETVALTSDPRQILAAWIKAQGGTEKAVEQMMR